MLNVSRTMLLLLITVLTTGCSTIIDARKQKQSYIHNYYTGDLAQAAHDLNKKNASRGTSGDALMWCLDQGTANFTAGLYQQSVDTFEWCELLIKEYDDRAVINLREGGVEIGAVLTNANALPYTGMYLDRVMLNAYKALGYFALNNPQAAQVELRRMRYAQKKVVRHFKEKIAQSEKNIRTQNQKNQRQSGGDLSVSFSDLEKNAVIHEAYEGSADKANKLYGNLSNPFVSYFSAIGYLLENNYTEALVDFRNLYKMLPNNLLIQQDYVSGAKKIGARLPRKLRRGKAYSYPLNRRMVYVLLFNGRAPALKQEKIQMILPFVGYTGIAFPRYEYFSSFLQGMKIDYQYHQKNQSIHTEQIANFDAIMAQEYHEQLPSMMTRIAVSTLAKEMASYAVVHAARESSRRERGRGDPNIEVGALILTGLYKALFNTADTRSWETLPQEIQIAHVPIPDDGILKISPVRGGKVTNIQLGGETDNAIVFIRALNAGKLVYKLFEIQ